MIASNTDLLFKRLGYFHENIIRNELYIVSVVASSVTQPAIMNDSNALFNELSFSQPFSICTRYYMTYPRTPDRTTVPASSLPSLVHRFKCLAVKIRSIVTGLP